VRAAFNQRRKTLINALSAQLPETDKGQLEAILTSLGYDARIRGEVLDIPAFARISDAIFHTHIAPPINS
jgi:16S rRNA (adenine1518-N6/adenine1519-N6)-dimethyltransferase